MVPIKRPASGQRLLLALAFLLNNVWSMSQKPEEVYARSLGNVTEQIGKKYAVSFRFEDESLKDKTVQYAQWRFAGDLATTLDNVLKPLDLIYTKPEGNVYLIKSYSFYRRT